MAELIVVLLACGIVFGIGAYVTPRSTLHADDWQGEQGARR